MMRADVWSWLPDGDVRRLSSGDGAWMQASIHPDGEHAVFWGGSALSPPRLWRSPTDRSDPEALTDATSGARHGAYGLRGVRLVFASDRASGNAPGRMNDEVASGTPPPGSHWNLFTMALDGGDVRQVTNGPHVDPRGDRLIVHSDRDGRWGLHELPLDGSPMRPLHPPGHESDICAHGTRAGNGVLTFDQVAMTELTAAGPPQSQ